MRARRSRLRRAGAERRSEEIALRSAERQAAEVLGYRVTADNEDEFTAEQVAEFDAVAQSFLDGEDEPEPELDDLIDLVGGQLQEVVQDTVDRRSTEPARVLVDRILWTDREVLGETPDEPPPGVTLAFLVLTSWIGRARSADTDPDAVLGWVADALGARAAGAAAALRGLLVGGEQEQAALGEPADELGEDLLLALIWLVAGLVAVHNGGDAARLTEFDPPEAAR